MPPLLGGLRGGGGSVKELGYKLGGFGAGFVAVEGGFGAPFWGDEADGAIDGGGEEEL